MKVSKVESKSGGMKYIQQVSESFEYLFNESESCSEPGSYLITDEQMEKGFLPTWDPFIFRYPLQASQRKK